ncbi:hypothetical protein THZB04_50087 [Vibrio owensii]|nr:hypothetical protein THZB04_50087 [Vibrio owensii]
MMLCAVFYEIDQKKSQTLDIFVPFQKHKIHFWDECENEKYSSDSLPFIDFFFIETFR